MSRENQRIAYARLTYQGQSYDLGEWDQKSGGTIDSDEEKYKPAGMAELALGGTRTIDDIELERIYLRERDVALRPVLKAAVGKGTLDVWVQEYDENDQAFAEPDPYTGKLKSYSPPDGDSTSGSASKVQIVCSVAGNV